MPRSGDTIIGGDQREFPITRILFADPARAAADFCRFYWKPIYAYIRSVRRIPVEDAKDVTQDFIADAVATGMLPRYRPGRGSFRVFLKGAIRRFLGKRHRERVALKRGGGRALLSLDETACRNIDTQIVGRSPGLAFDTQWRQNALDLAIADLRREWAARPAQLKIFEAYELSPSPPTYPSLARKYRVSEADVNNYLRAARKRLRELISIHK